MEKISGNVLVIKEINLSIVRKALKNLKSATKSQIAESTGLTSATVGTILQLLIKDNEIMESKKVKSNGGRPAQEFSYNFDFMHALIIYPFEDKEQTSLSVDVVNLEGVSIAHEIIEVQGQVDTEILKSIAKDKIKKFPKIKIMGFGNPGVNSKEKILQSDYKELINCNLNEEFMKEFGIPVVVENSVHSAVIGFKKRRSGKNLVYFFFSEKSAPSSGLLINGKIQRGSRNYAGGITYFNEMGWGKELYGNFDKFCTEVSRMINFTSCLLNPDTVIIAGTFIEEKHVEFIKEYCKKSLIEDIMPRIYLSKNFYLDYKEGLITRALEVLVPDVSIRRK